MSAAAVMSSAAPRPFSARLGDVLRLFTGCRGSLGIAWRSVHGFGEGRFALPVRPAPGTTPAVPLPILDAILDGHGLRIAPVTQDGDRLQDLPVAWVLWRLKGEFGCVAGGPHRYCVPPAEQARVREALTGVPLTPAVLIDAGPEVAACWRLARPIAVDREPQRAFGLLERLATRLGGDVEHTLDLKATLPLAGVVRNWNSTDPDLVNLIDVEPGRTYPIEDLERVCAAPTTKGGRT